MDDLWETFITNCISEIHFYNDVENLKLKKELHPHTDRMKPTTAGMCMNTI